MRGSKQSAGWTLLECMIVVSIIGVTALIGIPSWIAARTRSQAEVCKSNQRLIFEQINIYCLDFNKPCTIDEFSGISDIIDILYPESGAKYVKRKTAFHCPGNSVDDDFDDYRFARDGRRIIDIECDFDEVHNGD